MNADSPVNTAALLAPMTLRGLTIPNRIVVSPMCQYCAQDGFADDWHLVHLGSRAVGGAGLVFAEATAVTAQGRISATDLGIWTEAHIEPLARVTAFLRRMGAVSGMQLAHAGRKASCLPPWTGGARVAPEAEDGWEIVAPSAIPFSEGEPAPRALDTDSIAEIKSAFVMAARRAVAAGFDVVELHAAHGYLLHQFLSPLSNKRGDEYGGTLENRMRLTLETAEALRNTLPESMPLMVRVSATDWVDGGWDLEQTVALAKELRGVGVDLMDITSGGLVPHAKIPVGPGYQVPFAEAVRKRAGMPVSAVGMITDPAQAEAIVSSGQADMVMLGRQMLREPYFAHRAFQELGADAKWPTQYGYAVRPRKA
ncbi:NADH:flavin oxidoreductase/NADH oxidase [Fundidesulfovibrio agrisoli]|uniref:NADH:flavin oxidoreductase/NADH oxidase n=1 Tax=Fundidesulfovibrio agrisoli TaxID=2922717 RepID=UPI001FAE694A|nr:NADH:flavin oxidoreductase/NADH oxidase [Fundidesulfovibrio agrisoli]